MAWDDEAVPTLRVLINDAVVPYTYTDERLTTVLVSVAKLLVAELSFNTDYTVTVSTETISPDPEDDEFFIPLLVLKAAYIISGSEYKTYSLSSGSVTDGPSTINLGNVASSLKERMKFLLDDYNKAKLQYSLGNAIGCKSILTECEYIYSKCYNSNCFDYLRNRECR